MSLQILRPITIKAKVTEGLKDRLFAEIKRSLEIMEDELHQLDTQVKRAQLTASVSPQQQMQLRQIVESEKAKRAEKKAQLEDDMRGIASLPVGAEVLQGTAQTLVTVDIGSELDDLPAYEIVVEDGKVIAIRKGDQQ